MLLAGVKVTDGDNECGGCNEPQGARDKLNFVLTYVNVCEASAPH